MKNIILVISIITIFLILGCTQPTIQENKNPFEKLSDTVCTENGKPLIRYYATTWCPHCQYINPVINKVMDEYKDRVVYRHYDLDINTPPVDDLAEFNKFSPNGSIPAFSFGCQYYRIGNSFEETKNTEADANEFRYVIERLLNN